MPIDQMILGTSTFKQQWIDSMAAVCKRLPERTRGFKTRMTTNGDLGQLQKENI